MKKFLTKLFRKILLSTFAIGATLFIGNKAFAQDYKVNIAVVGDKRSGKTQIIRRISGEEFQDPSIESPLWNHGVYGKRKTYVIGDDTFHCKYYDAPGYLQKPDATLDQQIESKAIKDANIALIVVDPQQTAGIDSEFTSSIDEAMMRHAHHVRKVNPNCKIVVVANKVDTITDPTQLTVYQEMMDGSRRLHRRLEIDSIFTSAKTDVGIPELEGKIKNLLDLNKAELPKGCHDFVDCKCGHTHEGSAATCKKGYRGDLYCSEACLKKAEAEPCSRNVCSDKRRFLRSNNEGFISPRTNRMYCSSRCRELAEIGESCACGDKCPNRDKKYFRDQNQGFISPHGTHKFYCCHECYVKEEGTYCADEHCCVKFVVADGKEGENFFTNPKSHSKYCPQHKNKANTCTLL